MVNKMIIFGVVIFLSMVSNASAFEFDNNIDFDPSGKYGTATIKNLWGLGDTLAEIELLDNSDVCSTDCYASGRLRLYERSKLIDGLRFELGVVTDYKVYIQTGTRSKKIIDYGTELRGDGGYYVIEIGSHNEDVPVLELYDGAELEVGEYNWVIEGKKDAPITVDWIGEWMGVEVVEWALWNGAEAAVAYYNFDEVAGDAINLVGGVANGTVSPGASRGVPGLIKNATIFSTDNVSLGFNNIFNFTSEFSYSLWINKTAASEDIISKREGAGVGGLDYGLVFDGAGGLTASTKEKGGGLVSNPTVAMGEDNWNHVVYLANGSDVVIYVNGTEESKISYDGTLSASGAHIILAQDGRGDPQYLKGGLDEIGIWNRSLTPTEVAILYNNGDGLPFAVLDKTLNSPVDGAIATDSPVIFNSSAAIGGGASLVNATIFIWDSSGAIFNRTTNIVTGVQNETLFNVSMSVGIFQWNVLWCGTADICTFADQNFTLTWGLSVTGEEFNNVTTEGLTESFVINVTIGEGSTISSSDFIYDGVSTGVDSINQLSLTNFTIKKSLFIVGVDESVNKSFFWSFNVDGVIVNSTTRNQTINNFIVGNCSVNSIKILNFSTVDEELQTPLNSEIDIAVNILSLDRTVRVANFSTSVNSTSVSVCLNQTITSSNPFIMDVVVKYSAEDHEIEYYNIANSTLNNATLSRNITLFDLLSNDSTPFRVTFTGDTFLPVPGALLFLDRQYVDENNFKTVELPLTDPNGQAVIHLVRNDIIYNIRFLSQSGDVLGNFQEVTAFCEDPLLQNCQIQLSSASNASDSFTYDELTGLSFQSSPVFNSTTRVVSFNFVVPGGVTKTVSMNVTRNDVFGNRTVCQNSLTSSSGILFCSVPSSISDTILSTEITVDGETVLLSTVDIDATDLGSIGYVLWFVFTLVLIFGVGDSKNGVLIALLIGYVGAVALGISKGTLLGFGASGTWIIIVTVLGIWRLNRNKVQ